MAKTNSTADIRAAFEAEMRKNGLFEQGAEGMAVDEQTGDYLDPDTAAMWAGFRLGWLARQQATD